MLMRCLLVFICLLLTLGWAASRLTPPVSTVWCGIWCAWQPYLYSICHGPGRCAAWAAAPSLHTPVLVEQVVGRAAVAAFWSALADFASTTVVVLSGRIV
jgi:hypothetical protein